jgi:hypothetical protein
VAEPCSVRDVAKTPHGQRLDSRFRRPTFEYAPPLGGAASCLSVFIRMLPMSLPSEFNSSQLTELPAELWQYARKETLQPEPGRERRRDRRFSLITNVRVVPVDRKHRPIGPPFAALSSGMSISGIRLIHTQPPPSKFLLLEFDGQSARFVLSVLRSRPIGDCYEIAGRLSSPREGHPSPKAPAIVAPCVDLSVDELELPASLPNDSLHWAGVSAAAQVLVAESKSVR